MLTGAAVWEQVRTEVADGRQAYVVCPLVSESSPDRENAIMTIGSHMLELAKGLANERLFYNYRDHSIVVNGQILHGNAARSVTNTYNFTISPRG